MAPSGWLTFNQFFAREIKPGKRPIADPRDDSVIVSPADAVFKGSWRIEDDSSLVVKGVNWPIAQLLDGSPYKDEFRNGIYTHSFLYVDDYHRFHTPVAGEVKEIRNVHGRVYLDVIRGEDGELSVMDGESYQFNQERGLMVIDSPEAGLVAVLPVGDVVHLVGAVDGGSRGALAQGRGVRVLPVRRLGCGAAVPGPGDRARGRGGDEVFAGGADCGLALVRHTFYVNQPAIRQSRIP